MYLNRSTSKLNIWIDCSIAHDILWLAVCQTDINLNEINGPLLPPVCPCVWLWMAFNECIAIDFRSIFIVFDFNVLIISYQLSEADVTSSEHFQCVLGLSKASRSFWIQPNGQKPKFHPTQRTYKIQGNEENIIHIHTMPGIFFSFWFAFCSNCVKCLT